MQVKRPPVALIISIACSVTVIGMMILAKAQRESDEADAAALRSCLRVGGLYVMATGQCVTGRDLHIWHVRRDHP